MDVSATKKIFSGRVHGVPLGSLRERDRLCLTFPTQKSA